MNTPKELRRQRDAFVVDWKTAMEWALLVKPGAKPLGNPRAARAAQSRHDGMRRRDRGYA